MDRSCQHECGMGGGVEGRGEEKEFGDCFAYRRFFYFGITFFKLDNSKNNKRRSVSRFLSINMFQYTKGIFLPM